MLTLTVLTHNHDVSVSQDGAMLVGGFTLVNSTVFWPGVVANYSVLKHLAAGDKGFCGQKGNDQEVG